MPGPQSYSTREIVREGAQEVTEKLRQDLSRWSRFRRFVSLKPQIPCLDCDGAGKVQCTACGGSGKSAMVRDDGEQEACPRCGGQGSITCVECGGKGLIPNRHRKPLIAVLWVGGIAWAIILFELWGGDILPAQRAAVLQRGEHGRSVPVPPAGTSPTAPALPPSAGASSQGGQAVPAQSPQGGYGAPAAPSAPTHGNSVPSQGTAQYPPAAWHGNSVSPPPAGGATPGAYGQPYGATGYGGVPPYGTQRSGYGGGNSLPTRPGSYGR
jgi:hypothetical protein